MADSSRVVPLGRRAAAFSLPAWVLTSIAPLPRIVVPLLPAGLLSTTTFRSVQAEPLTLCLSVAASVAGLIANHNRGDGGLSAVLQSNLQYHRLMMQELDNIQSKLSDIYISIQKLPEAIQKILYLNRLNEIQTSLVVHVKSYINETQNRASSFRNFQDWKSDEQTRAILGNIMLGLDTMIETVKEKKYYDSLTAIYLTSAVGAALGTRFALGDSRAQLAVEAQRYLDAFSFIHRVDEEGTAAHELQRCRLSVDKAKDDLINLGYSTYQPEGMNTETVVHSAVAVHYNICLDPEYIKVFRATCSPKEPKLPRPKLGQPQYFEHRTIVRPYFVKSPDNGAATAEIRQYEYDADSDIALVPTLSRQPDEILQVSKDTPEEHLMIARDSLTYTAGKNNKLSLSKRLNELNTDIALGVLAASALLAVSATRDSLLQSLGKRD